MIIQERRVSKVQRYKSKGGLCIAKSGDFSKIGARNQKIAKEVERKDFSSTNSNIHVVPQILTALPIHRRARFEKGIFLQLNEAPFSHETCLQVIGANRSKSREALN